VGTQYVTCRQEESHKLYENSSGASYRGGEGEKGGLTLPESGSNQMWRAATKKVIRRPERSELSYGLGLPAGRWPHRKKKSYTKAWLAISYSLYASYGFVLVDSDMLMIYIELNSELDVNNITTTDSSQSNVRVRLHSYYSLLILGL
jgi:hypothetical protein